MNNPAPLNTTSTTFDMTSGKLLRVANCEQRKAESGPESAESVDDFCALFGDAGRNSRRDRPFDSAGQELKMIRA